MLFLANKLAGQASTHAIIPTGYQPEQKKNREKYRN